MSVPIVDRIRALAKLHGWAIGEHGSMARDIDLIAVPWAEGASSIQVLVAAFEQVLGLVPEGGITSHKPLGRHCVLLRTTDARISHVVYDWSRFGKDPDPYAYHRTFWNPPIVDLSLMDPRAALPRTLGDLVPGLRPVDPKDLEEYERAMRDEAIPEIITEMQRRAALAAEARSRQLMKDITLPADVERSGPNAAEKDFDHG